MAAMLISALLISSEVATLSFVTVKGNWNYLIQSPITDLPIIAIQSPTNDTNYENTVYLDLTVFEPHSWFTDATPYGSIYSISYLLDGLNHSIYQIPHWTLDNLHGRGDYNIPLETLSEGNHSMQIIVEGHSWYWVTNGEVGNVTVENKEWLFNITKTIDFAVNIPTPTANPSPNSSPNPTPTPAPSPSPSPSLSSSPSPTQQPTPEATPFQTNGPLPKQDYTLPLFLTIVIVATVAVAALVYFRRGGVTRVNRVYLKVE